MVEKWLQSKSNPYISTRRATKVVMRKPFYSNQVSNPMAVQRRAPTRRPMSGFSKMTATRFGVPIQLFKDSDKDGVMNVFDCKPYNKRKQDVMHPQNFGSGVGDMYARQEQSRQQKEYQRMLKEMQKQEEQRIIELQRIQGETIVVDNTRTIYQDTPYVFNVAGDKLVNANSAEGKAGIAKLQSYSTGGKSTTTTTTSPRKPILQQTGPMKTYTGQQAKNIIATGDPNKSGKSAPKQNVVQRAVASVRSFFSGSKSSGGGR